MLKYIAENWGRLFFGLAGLVFLAFTIRFLLRDNVAEASAAFAMSFLSFIYSNLSRFKRFKGLGFEAELWEDKQKEAADLIDRLKDVVTIYTNEIMLGNVKRGRWSDGVNWKAHWDLYDQLVTQHTNLGQDIDFSDLKAEMDAYFVLDLTRPLYTTVQQAIARAKSEAEKGIKLKFGSPIKDPDGFGNEINLLNSIKDKVKDQLKLSRERKLPQAVLDLIDPAKELLSKEFSIDLDIAPETIRGLERLAALQASGPIKVTPDLLEMDPDAE